MPSNDVIVRTEQLIRALKEIASASNTAGASLAETEKFLERFVGVNLGSIRESALLIANFSKQLRGLGADTAQVNALSKSFAELLGKIQATIAMQDKMSAMGKTGRATQLLGKAIVAGNVGEQQRQQAIIRQSKLLAEQANEELAASEQIWKRNLEFANRIEELRAKIISSLLGRATANRLPSGLIPGVPQLPPGYLAMQAGTLTNYQYQAPEYNKLPPGNIPNVPQLPAGNIQQLPKLLPYTTASTVYNRNAVYPEQYPSNEVLNQFRQNRMPVIPPAPAQLMSGITELDRAINERIQNVANTIPTTPLEFNADDTIKENLGGGGRDPNLSDKANKLLEDSIDLTKEQFEAYGLSAQGAQNLSNNLEDLGMKSGRIVSATTEMSTGITTVGVQAKGAGEVIQTFTAHLDKNGNVLQDTQKRFRSFGSAVMRDVVEVLKWTIAITAIYTPIRKLGELLEQMKTIQLDMVDVQIVLGDSTAQFGTAMEAAAKIATETSSSLEGVIEGYSLAAAASASAGNEFQRTVVTESLLKDSMILSKLAGIEQKQAMDTIVGSLSQLGMKLTDGTQLLDSWVAVSKKANVSVKDMSTSFTIVGSAAQEAGLNFHELNALIGALAQSTNLSADELGNAVRGIIAAMQTDKAQTEFAKYGIATKTVAGDFRDLMNILEEVKAMSAAGFLDEKAMGALMQAGGAGARRGAQLSAIVKNLDTVMNLVAISENASGDAARAMELEMGTLDAATTRLNNAFAELAVTLGGEGGVLGFLTAVTNGVTTLVRGVKDLSSTLKIAAPILATFMVARGILSTQQGAAMLNKNIPMRLAGLLTPAGGGMVSETGKAIGGRAAVGGWAPMTNWLLGMLQGSKLGATTTNQVANVGRVSTIADLGKGIWGRIGRPFFGTTAGQGMVNTGALPGGLNKMGLGTLLGPLLVAGSSLAAGGPNAAGRAGSGLAGGLFMAAIKGSPLWATVGSIIATAFYDKFLTFSDDLATGWVKAIAEAKKSEAEAEEETPETRAEKLSQEAKDSLDIWETFKLNLVQEASNLWSNLPWFKKQGATGKRLSDEEVAMGAALPGSIIGWTLDAESRQRLNEAYNAVVGTMADATDELVILPDAQQSEIARLAATASGDIMNKAIDAMTTGVSSSVQQYIDSQTIAEKIGSTVTKLMEVQQFLPTPVPIGVAGKEVIPFPGYKPMTAKEATALVSELNTDELNLLVGSLAGVDDTIKSIIVLNDQIAQQDGVVTKTQAKNLQDYETALMQVAPNLVQILNIVRQSTQYRQVEEQLLPVLKLPEMSPQQYAQIEKEARAGWLKYFEQNNIPPDVAEAWIAQQQEYIVQLGENMTPIRTTIPIEWFTPPIDAAGIGKQLNIQDLSNQLTKSQFDQMMAVSYPQLREQLVNLGYQPQEDQSLMIFQDGAELAHVDQTILQLLMRDLIDVEEKKGLQGMYNLPEGATFYVPVSAYEMSKATVTEMAGGGGGGLAAMSDLIYWLSQIATNTAKTAEINPFEGQNLNEALPGEGFEFGGKEYKMFGPPTPEATNLLGYTYGNPLPVMITNLPQGTATYTVPETGEVIPMPEYNPAIPPTTGITPELNLHTETYQPTEPPSIGDWFKNWATQDYVGEDIGTLIDTIKTFFNNLFTPTNQTNQNQTQLPPVSEAPEVRLPTAMINWFSQQSMLTTPVSATTITQQPDQRPITTALNLSVDSSIVLTVDGRTLATIIKPYLYEDLLRFNATTSSTNRSVIA